MFVDNDTPISLNARANLRRICHERLKDECEVEVIDLMKNPEIAADEQIVAVPTLIKQSPLPERRMIGDLSNMKRVLVGLNLETANQ